MSALSNVVNLLVLNFCPQNESRRELLSGRQWKTIWLRSFDVDTVATRIACGDISQVLILESKTEPRSDFCLALRKNFPALSILRVSNAAESEKPWQSAIKVLPHQIDSFSLLREIEAGFATGRVVEKFHHTWSKQQDDHGFDPRFFTSIDLFHVIDRMFSYFSGRLLCEDIHWIKHSELEGFLKQDFESLALELEVDYKKSHRLRSLNEQNPAVTLGWLRELPLESFDKQKPAVINHDFCQHLWLPIADQGRTLGYLVFRGYECAEIELLLEKMEVAIQMMSRFVNFAIQMWDTQSLTLIDDLTDLHNQRYLPRALDREIARAKRLNKKFTMLFLDVDYFKKVNDSSGHWVGSRILVEIGKLFRDSLRTCDYAFRYGGDEFVAILVDSDAVSSVVVAERLRKKIEGTSFVIDGQAFKVTVSIGLACYPDHAQTRQSIIEIADEAMYKGKAKSRNIVYVAS